MSAPLLEPPFDQPIFALALRAAFARSTPRALSLPSALSPASAALLRRLARPRLERFALADRGRYRFVALGAPPPNPSACAPLETACAPLLLQLRDFAAAVCGRALGAPAVRLVWLARGDYALRLDDASAGPRAPALEVQLDLSPEPGPAAATVYSEGPWIHLPIAQLPGQLSLVERGPASSRCDRYRSVLVGPRAFVHLRASFPLAES